MITRNKIVMGGGKRIRSCYLKEQRFSGRKGKKKARGVKKSGREREVEMLVRACVCLNTELPHFLIFCF